MDAVKMSELQEKELDWLWKGRVPRGLLTVIDGDPGLGKSGLTIELVARMTSGSKMPGNVRAIDGRALMICPEDGAAETVLPRLKAAGADLDRVEVVSALKLPEDGAALEQHVRKNKTKLVVIDPVMAVLTGNTNSDQGVRKALMPLVVMAKDNNCTVVLVRHLNKTAGSDPMYRGGASIGIVAVARSGLMITPDHDDKDARLVVQYKSNLGQLARAMKFKFKGGKIDWLGECDITADDALRVPSDGEKRTTLQEAEEIIKAALGKGPAPANDVLQDGYGCGISTITMRRAKHYLGVGSRKSGDSWLWELPEPRDAQPAPRQHGLRAAKKKARRKMLKAG